MKDFKAFIDKGNLLQLAVAFIMGVTFAAVVTSLVKDIIMPAVGLALGGLDFTNLFVVLKDGDPAGPVQHHRRRPRRPEPSPSTTACSSMPSSSFIIVALVLFLFVRPTRRPRSPRRP